MFETSSTAEYARVTGGNKRQLEGTEEAGKWYIELVKNTFPMNICHSVFYRGTKRETFK